MLTLNENINGLNDRKEQTPAVLYASKQEMEAHVKKLEKRINNLFEMQMRSAFNDQKSSAQQSLRG